MPQPRSPHLGGDAPKNCWLLQNKGVGVGAAACVSQFLGRGGERAGPHPSHLPFQVCFQKFKTCLCKRLKSGVLLGESIRLNLGPDFKRGLVKAQLSKMPPSHRLTFLCLTLSDCSVLTSAEWGQRGASSAALPHGARPRSPQPAAHLQPASVGPGLHLEAFRWVVSCCA